MSNSSPTWIHGRSAGLLLHPSSLPGPHGIGTIGAEAMEFVEFLGAAELALWEMLPTSVAGFGDSPYSSPASETGNPMLIDLSALVSFGLIEYGDLKVFEALPEGSVDYARLNQVKRPLLSLVFKRFREKNMAYLPNYGLFRDFCEEEAEWLDPAAQFLAIKRSMGNRPWYEWPDDMRNPDSETFLAACDSQRDAIEEERFLQYLYQGQWRLLRVRARESGVELATSLPFYPALDSADVFFAQDYFILSDPAASSPRPAYLDPEDRTSSGFYAWSGAVFDWKALQADGFGWWQRRLKCIARHFDVVRLLNADAMTRCGFSRDGSKSTYSESECPWQDFMRALEDEFANLKVIADVSGGESPATRSWRRQYGLPCSSLFITGFDGMGNHPELPHFLPHNHVAYTSDATRETAAGWYENAGWPAQDHLRRYLRVSGEDVSWDLIRCAFRSAPGIVIIPMQDLMSLDNRSRYVTPGESTLNWRWRIRQDDWEWQTGTADYLRDLAWLFDR